MDALKWWQTATFYQIYPRSFADSDGDGIGDLQGIIERLDYLQQLGIGAIWLSPHYPSPQFDCGYDVADYVDVDPKYGTLDTFRELLREAHRRDIRLILDLVLNHTSDQHPWFQESRAGRDNPKRDWYVWRDATPDTPPNNWRSSFGGSAWEYDPATGQSYYHMFLKQQPDLNWRNPQVREAMYNGMRFWLGMGVDGFRIDAIDTLFEDPGWPDHNSPLTQTELMVQFHSMETRAQRRAGEQAWRRMFRYQHGQPGMLEVLRELRQVVDEYPDRVLVGETDELSYCGDDKLDMVFNFPLMQSGRLIPSVVRANQRKRLDEMPAGVWPCNTLGNHDTGRSMTRYADGKHDRAIAIANLTLLLTLRGTPFLYNGEEIGMTDLLLEDLNQFRDITGLHLYEVLTGLIGLPPEEALQMAAQNSRDRARTPMQWSAAANAGFSPQGAQTWLPVHPNHAGGVNVEAQNAEPGSLLNHYRRLINLRRTTPALLDGDFTVAQGLPHGCLAYLRRSESTGQTCLVALNLSARRARLDLDLQGRQARCLYSSGERSGQPLERVTFAAEPYEVFIAELV